MCTKPDLSVSSMERKSMAGDVKGPDALATMSNFRSLFARLVPPPSGMLHSLGVTQLCHFSCASWDVYKKPNGRLKIAPVVLNSHLKASTVAAAGTHVLRQLQGFGHATLQTCLTMHIWEFPKIGVPFLGFPSRGFCSIFCLGYV